MSYDIIGYKLLRTQLRRAACNAAIVRNSAHTHTYTYTHTHTHIHIYTHVCMRACV